jgi:4-aminobutyrate aminotransferase
MIGLNGIHPKMVTEAPGPKAQEIIELDSRFLATSTKCSPVVGEKGKGAMVMDVDGNWYVDFTSGIGVTNTGHCHPKVVSAITNQASQLMHFAGTDFYYRVQVSLAEKLAGITPGDFPKKVFYTNSGAESVECAIKLSKWATGRTQFIGFIGGFHGRTMGANAFMANGMPAIGKYFPMMPGVTKVPYAYCYRCAYKLEYPGCGLWCAKILDEVYFSSYLPPQEVASVFLEPVQGEGGYIVPPNDWMKAVRDVTSKHGILLVDDEVQAGFGRTGKWFCAEHYGVEPDVIALAKGIASGFPMGAIVFRKELDWKVPGAHSNTYGGNPVGCAASLATIEVIEKEKLMLNAEKMGKYLHKRILELEGRHGCIGDVRGIGLMQATEFVKDRRTKEPAPKLRDAIEDLAWKKGLMLLGCGRSTIRYIPPLLVNSAQIDQAMDILDASIREALKQ